MTQIYHRHDITLDQVVALKTAATRLGRDFDGTFNTETIERFLHSSYDQFATRADRELPATAGRTLCPPTASRTGQSGRQIQRRQIDRVVFVHPQRRALADGNGILRPDGR